jgi:hypothetical protein
LPEPLGPMSGEGAGAIEASVTIPAISPTTVRKRTRKRPAGNNSQHVASGVDGTAQWSVPSHT